MTPQDFAYWLQGFFELSNSENITERQSSLILKHLDLVKYYEDKIAFDTKSKKDSVAKEMTCGQFIYWLRGYFDISKPVLINIDQTTVIKNTLNRIFKHEIDGSYTDNNEYQQEMNNIHSGYDDHNTVVRC